MRLLLKPEEEGKIDTRENHQEMTMKTSERREKGLRVRQQLFAGNAREDGPTLAQVFPDFTKMHQEHLFGEVFSRSQLALRDRLMVNLTGLIFHKFNFGIKNCMLWALNNGITREEILEIILHVNYYAGWPCGVNAMQVAREVFPPLEEKKQTEADGLEECELDHSEWLERGRRMLQQLYNDPSTGGGRNTIEEVFPDFWEMMQGHLFGEIWTRPGLALRERLMVNLTGLIFHKFDFGMANCMRWALNNGITREEILEIIMHVAHYGGWPCGVNAIKVAHEVFAEKNSDSRLVG
jgi:4-carboxymuconolactone decarboxylase